MQIPEGDVWLARQIGEDRLQIAYLINENNALRSMLNERAQTEETEETAETPEGKEEANADND